MTSQNLHPSQQELLLYTDGELSSHDCKLVRSHLVFCPECLARTKEMEITLANFMQAQSLIHKPASDIAGPRALFKARMAELVQSSGNMRWTHFRFALDARGLAVVCALALIAVLGIQLRYLRNANRGNQRNAYAGLLPNPNLTPGSTRPVTFSDLCSSNSDEVVHAVPDRLQKKFSGNMGCGAHPPKTTRSII